MLARALALALKVRQRLAESSASRAAQARPEGRSSSETSPVSALHLQIPVFTSLKAPAVNPQKLNRRKQNPQSLNRRKQSLQSPNHRKQSLPPPLEGSQSKAAKKAPKSGQRAALSDTLESSDTKDATPARRRKATGD